MTKEKSKPVKKAKQQGRSFKQGMDDIKTVLEEGNFKLFVKQIIAVALIFLLYRTLSGKFIAKIQNMDGQIEAITAQQVNEKEYVTNKKLLISLEPHFASIESKNEWLLAQTIAIFKRAKITPDVQGAQTEDTSNPTFISTALQVAFPAGYDRLGHLLETIENRHEYVKISGFSIEKNKDPGQMGDNKVSLRLNTIFPKEKIANSTIFKDYDKLVEEQKKEAAKRNRKKKEK